MSHYISAPKFPLRNTPLKYKTGAGWDGRESGKDHSWSKSCTMEFCILVISALLCSFYNVLALPPKGNGVREPNSVFFLASSVFILFKLFHCWPWFDLGRKTCWHYREQVWRVLWSEALVKRCLQLDYFYSMSPFFVGWFRVSVTLFLLLFQARVSFKWTRDLAELT